MPTLASFRAPGSGWKLVDSKASENVWINETLPDFRVQRFAPFAPSDLPDDYPNIESHRKLFETSMAQSQGAVISVDFLDVKGREAFRTIFKFRMPGQGMGMRYLGTLMFPFMEFFCGFTFQCDEHGTTGLRENMVALLESKINPVESNEKSSGSKAQVVNSIEELFALWKQSPLVRLPSDDEKYDELIVNHPLSRVRRYLAELSTTIEFDEDVQSALPYRGASKRSLM